MKPSDNVIPTAATYSKFLSRLAAASKGKFDVQTLAQSIGGTVNGRTHKEIRNEVRAFLKGL